MSWFSNITSGLYNAEHKFLHGIEVVGNAITHPLATAESVVDDVGDFATHVAKGGLSAAMPFAQFAGSAVSGANDLVASDIKTVGDAFSEVVDSGGKAIGGIASNLTLPLMVGAAVVAFMLTRT